MQTTLNFAQYTVVCVAIGHIKDIIEKTYAHDEKGRRLEEAGDCSAADIVEQLCEIEGVINGAADILKSLVIKA